MLPLRRPVPWLRWTSAGVAVVFFYSNVLAPPLAQANFWDDRRQAVQAVNGTRPGGEGGHEETGRGDARVARSLHGGLTIDIPLASPHLTPTATLALASSAPGSTTEAPAIRPLGPPFPDPSFTGNRLDSSSLSPPWESPSTPLGMVSLPNQGRVRGRMGGASIPPWLLEAVGPYGEVREISLPPSRGATPQRLILLLQDAHEVLEAQTNIAHILQSLVDQGKVTLIGLEGAHGPFNLEPFRSFHHREAAKEVANDLLRRAYISGPEYVGITSPKLPLLWGVDDPVHYVANVQAFKTTLPQEAQALSVLETFVKTLDTWKARLYSPELAALDAKSQAYHAGTLSLGDYVTWLATQGTISPSPPPSPLRGRGQGEGVRGEVSPWNSKRFPHLSRFHQALTEEHALNLQQVERDRTQLIKQLTTSVSSTLSRPGERGRVRGEHANPSSTPLTPLIQASLAFRSGQTSAGAYYTFLQQFCQHHGIKLTRYPAFTRYLRYVIAADHIDPNRLFEELDQLETERFTALTTGPGPHAPGHLNPGSSTAPASSAQQRLVTLTRQAALLKKLFQHNLTPEEWAAYQRDREAIRQLPRQLAMLQHSRVDFKDVIPRSPALEAVMRGRRGDLRTSKGEIPTSASSHENKGRPPRNDTPGIPTGGSDFTELSLRAGTLLVFLDPFERFYLEAEARNHALLTNLLTKLDELGSDPNSIRGLTPTRLSGGTPPSPLGGESLDSARDGEPVEPGRGEGVPRIAVLVAGGFHTPGVQRLFRDQRLPFVTITPKITHVEDTTRYLDVFTRTRTPLEQLLLGEKLFVNPPRPLAQMSLLPDTAINYTVVARLALLLFTLTLAIYGLSSTEIQQHLAQLAGPFHEQITLTALNHLTSDALELHVTLNGVMHVALFAVAGLELSQGFKRLWHTTLKPRVAPRFRTPDWHPYTAKGQPYQVAIVSARPSLMERLHPYLATAKRWLTPLERIPRGWVTRSLPAVRLDLGTQRRAPLVLTFIPQHRPLAQRLTGWFPSLSPAFWMGVGVAALGALLVWWVLHQFIQARKRVERLLPQILSREGPPSIQLPPPLPTSEELASSRIPPSLDPKVVKQLTTVQLNETPPPDAVRLLYALAATPYTSQQVRKDLRASFITPLRKLRNPVLATAIVFGLLHNSKILPRVFSETMQQAGFTQTQVTAVQQIFEATTPEPMPRATPRLAPSVEEQLQSGRLIYTRHYPERIGIYRGRLESINVGRLHDLVQEALRSRFAQPLTIRSLVLVGSFLYGFRTAPSDMDLWVIVDGNYDRTELHIDLPAEVIKPGYDRTVKKADVSVIGVRQLLNSPNKATGLHLTGIVLSNAVSPYQDLPMGPPPALNMLTRAAGLLHDAKGLAPINPEGQPMQPQVKALRRLDEVNISLAAIHPGLAIDLQNKASQMRWFLEGAIALNEIREDLKNTVQTFKGRLDLAKFVLIEKIVAEELLSRQRQSSWRSRLRSFGRMPRRGGFFAVIVLSLALMLFVPGGSGMFGGLGMVQPSDADKPSEGNGDEEEEQWTSITDRFKQLVQAFVEDVKRKGIKANQETKVFEQGDLTITVNYSTNVHLIYIYITSRHYKYSMVTIMTDPEGTFEKLGGYLFTKGAGQVSPESVAVALQSVQDFPLIEELKKVLKLPTVTPETLQREQERLQERLKEQAELRHIGPLKRRQRSTVSGANEVLQFQFGITRPGDQRATDLVTVGLGPCVGLTLYDPSTKTGLLAHFDATADVPKSFVEMLTRLQQFGANQSRLEARIIGGQTSQSEELVLKIRSQLREHGIPIKEQDVLGYAYSKSILLDTTTGEVYDYRGILEPPQEKLTHEAIMAETLARMGRPLIFNGSDRGLLSSPEGKMETAPASSPPDQTKDLPSLQWTTLTGSLEVVIQPLIESLQWGIPMVGILLVILGVSLRALNKIHLAPYVLLGMVSVLGLPVGLLGFVLGLWGGWTWVMVGMVASNKDQVIGPPITIIPIRGYRDILNGMPVAIDLLDDFSPSQKVAAVQDHLEKDNHRHLRSYVKSLFGTPIKLDDIAEIIGQEVKAGNVNSIFKVDVRLKSSGASRALTIVSAISEKQNTPTERDFNNMRYLSRTVESRYLPRLFGKGYGTFKGTAGPVQVSVFADEWLEGYYELHSRPSEHGTQFIVSNHDTGAIEYLNEEDSQRVSEQLARIFAVYSTNRRHASIGQFDLNAGDVVCKRSADGAIHLKLITVRKLHTQTHQHRVLSEHLLRTLFLISDESDSQTDRWDLSLLIRPFAIFRGFYFGLMEEMENHERVATTLTQAVADLASLVKKGTSSFWREKDQMYGVPLRVRLREQLMELLPPIIARAAETAYWTKEGPLRIPGFQSVIPQKLPVAEGVFPPLLNPSSLFILGHVSSFLAWLGWMFPSLTLLMAFMLIGRLRWRWGRTWATWTYRQWCRPVSLGSGWTGVHSLLPHPRISTRRRNFGNYRIQWLTPFLLVGGVWLLQGVGVLSTVAVLLTSNNYLLLTSEEKLPRSQTPSRRAFLMRPFARRPSESPVKSMELPDWLLTQVFRDAQGALVGPDINQLAVYLTTTDRTHLVAQVREYLRISPPLILEAETIASLDASLTEIPAVIETPRESVHRLLPSLIHSALRGFDKGPDVEALRGKAMTPRFPRLVFTRRAFIQRGAAMVGAMQKILPIPSSLTRVFLGGKNPLAPLKITTLEGIEAMEEMAQRFHLENIPIHRWNDEVKSRGWPTKFEWGVAGGSNRVFTKEILGRSDIDIAPPDYGKAWIDIMGQIVSRLPGAWSHPKSFEVAEAIEEFLVYEIEDRLSLGIFSATENLEAEVAQWLQTPEEVEQAIAWVQEVFGEQIFTEKPGESPEERKAPHTEVKEPSSSPFARFLQAVADRLMGAPEVHEWFTSEAVQLALEAGVDYEAPAEGARSQEPSAPDPNPIIGPFQAPMLLGPELGLSLGLLSGLWELSLLVSAVGIFLLAMPAFAFRSSRLPRLYSALLLVLGMGMLGWMVTILMADPIITEVFVKPLLVDTGIGPWLVGMSQKPTDADPTPPHHEEKEPERIDMNQADLAKLQKQLREAFPKSQLSDGTIKQIIQWRKERGLFTDFRGQLLSIRGIGSAILPSLLQRFAPLYKPLAQPLRLMFSPHGTSEEEHSPADELLMQEVLSKIDKQLAEIEPQRPVFLWLEHALPTLLLDDPYQIHNSLKRSPLSDIDLIRALKGPSLPPVVELFLQNMYQIFRKRQAQEDINLQFQRELEVDSFFRPLGKWIETQRKKRTVTLQQEQGGPYEAWLDFMRDHIWFEEAKSHVEDSDGTPWLEAMERWLLSMERSADLRDQAFADQLTAAVKQYPEAIHFVIRGSQHIATLPSHLEKRAIPHAIPIDENWLTDRPIPFQYLSEKSNFTSPFQRTRYFFAGLVDMMFDHSLKIMKADRGQATRFAKALLSIFTDEQIEEWFTQVRPAKGGESKHHLFSRTALWLSQQANLPEEISHFLLTVKDLLAPHTAQGANKANRSDDKGGHQAGVLFEVSTVWWIGIFAVVTAVLLAWAGRGMSRFWEGSKAIARKFLLQLRPSSPAIQGLPLRRLIAGASVLIALASAGTSGALQLDRSGLPRGKEWFMAGQGQTGKPSVETSESVALPSHLWATVRHDSPIATLQGFELVSASHKQGASLLWLSVLSLTVFLPVVIVAGPASSGMWFLGGLTTSEILVQAHPQRLGESQIFLRGDHIGHISHEAVRQNPDGRVSLRLTHLFIAPQFQGQEINLAVIQWLLRQTQQFAGNRVLTVTIDVKRDPDLAHLFLKNDLLDNVRTIGWKWSPNASQPHEMILSRDETMTHSFHPGYLAVELQGTPRRRLARTSWRVRARERPGLLHPTHSLRHFARGAVPVLLDFLGVLPASLNGHITTTIIRILRTGTREALEGDLGYYDPYWPRVVVREDLSQAGRGTPLGDFHGLTTVLGSVFAHETVHFLQYMFGIGLSRWDYRLSQGPPEVLPTAVGLYLLALGQGRKATGVRKAIQQTYPSGVESNVFMWGAVEHPTGYSLDRERIVRFLPERLHESPVAQHRVRGMALGGMAYRQYLSSGRWEEGRDLLRSQMLSPRMMRDRDNGFWGIGAAPDIFGSLDRLIGADFLSLSFLGDLGWLWLIMLFAVAGKPARGIGMPDVLTPPGYSALLGLFTSLGWLTVVGLLGIVTVGLRWLSKGRQRRFDLAPRPAVTPTAIRQRRSSSSAPILIVGALLLVGVATPALGLGLPSALWALDPQGLLSPGGLLFAMVKLSQGEQARVRELVRQLGDPSSGVRRHAAWTLVSIGISLSDRIMILGALKSRMATESQATVTAALSQALALLEDWPYEVTPTGLSLGAQSLIRALRELERQHSISPSTPMQWRHWSRVLHWVESLHRTFPTVEAELHHPITSSENRQPAEDRVTLANRLAVLPTLYGIGDSGFPEGKDLLDIRLMPGPFPVFIRLVQAAHALGLFKPLTPDHPRPWPYHTSLAGIPAEVAAWVLVSALFLDQASFQHLADQPLRTSAGTALEFGEAWTYRRATIDANTGIERGFNLNLFDKVLRQEWRLPADGLTVVMHPWQVDLGRKGLLAWAVRRAPDLWVHFRTDLVQWLQEDLGFSEAEVAALTDLTIASGGSGLVTTSPPLARLLTQVRTRLLIQAAKEWTEGPRLTWFQYPSPAFARLDTLTTALDRLEHADPRAPRTRHALVALVGSESLADGVKTYTAGRPTPFDDLQETDRAAVARQVIQRTLAQRLDELRVAKMVYTSSQETTWKLKDLSELDRQAVRDRLATEPLTDAMARLESEVWQPFLQQIEHRAYPSRLIRGLLQQWGDLAILMEDLPATLEDWLLTRVRTGQLNGDRLTTTEWVEAVTVLAQVGSLTGAQALQTWLEAPTATDREVPSEVQAATIEAIQNIRAAYRGLPPSTAGPPASILLPLGREWLAAFPHGVTWLLGNFFVAILLMAWVWKRLEARTSMSQLRPSSSFLGFVMAVLLMGGMVHAVALSLVAAGTMTPPKSPDQGERLSREVREVLTQKHLRDRLIAPGYEDYGAFKELYEETAEIMGKLLAAAKEINPEEALGVVPATVQLYLVDTVKPMIWGIYDKASVTIVGVSLGLITLCQDQPGLPKTGHPISKSVLAYGVAHQLAHVMLARAHAAKAFAGGDLVFVESHAYFSRADGEQELEADRIAIALLHHAGYVVHGGVVFFQALDHWMKVRDLFEAAWGSSSELQERIEAYTDHPARPYNFQLVDQRHLWTAEAWGQAHQRTSSRRFQENVIRVSTIDQLIQCLQASNDFEQLFFALLVGAHRLRGEQWRQVMGTPQTLTHPFDLRLQALLQQVPQEAQSAMHLLYTYLRDAAQVSLKLQFRESAEASQALNDINHLQKADFFHLLDRGILPFLCTVIDADPQGPANLLMEADTGVPSEEGRIITRVDVPPLPPARNERARIWEALDPATRVYLRTLIHTGVARIHSEAFTSHEAMRFLTALQTMRRQAKAWDAKDAYWILNDGLSQVVVTILSSPQCVSDLAEENAKALLNLYADVVSNPPRHPVDHVASPLYNTLAQTVLRGGDSAPLHHAFLDWLRHLPKGESDPGARPSLDWLRRPQKGRLNVVTLAKRLACLDIQHWSEDPQHRGVLAQGALATYLAVLLKLPFLKNDPDVFAQFLRAAIQPGEATHKSWQLLKALARTLPPSVVEDIVAFVVPKWLGTGDLSQLFQIDLRLLARGSLISPDPVGRALGYLQLLFASVGDLHVKIGMLPRAMDRVRRLFHQHPPFPEVFQAFLPQRFHEFHKTLWNTVQRTAPGGAAEAIPTLPIRIEGQGWQIEVQSVRSEQGEATIAWTNEDGVHRDEHIPATPFQLHLLQTFTARPLAVSLLERGNWGRLVWGLLRSTAWGHEDRWPNGTPGIRVLDPYYGLASAQDLGALLSDLALLAQGNRTNANFERWAADLSRDTDAYHQYEAWAQPFLRQKMVEEPLPQQSQTGSQEASAFTFSLPFMGIGAGLIIAASCFLLVWAWQRLWRRFDLAPHPAVIPTAIRQRRPLRQFWTQHWLFWTLVALAVTARLGWLDGLASWWGAQGIPSSTEIFSSHGLIPLFATVIPRKRLPQSFSLRFSRAFYQAMERLQKENPQQAARVWSNLYEWLRQLPTRTPGPHMSGKALHGRLAGKHELMWFKGTRIFLEYKVPQGHITGVTLIHLLPKSIGANNQITMDKMVLQAAQDILDPTETKDVEHIRKLETWLYNEPEEGVIDVAPFKDLVSRSLKTLFLGYIQQITNLKDLVKVIEGNLKNVLYGVPPRPVLYLTIHDIQQVLEDSPNDLDQAARRLLGNGKRATEEIVQDAIDLLTRWIGAKERILHLIRRELEQPLPDFFAIAFIYYQLAGKGLQATIRELIESWVTHQPETSEAFGNIELGYEALQAEPIGEIFNSPVIEQAIAKRKVAQEQAPALVIPDWLVLTLWWGGALVFSAFAVWQLWKSRAMHTLRHTLRQTSARVRSSLHRGSRVQGARSSMRRWLLAGIVVTAGLLLTLFLNRQFQPKAPLKEPVTTQTKEQTASTQPLDRSIAPSSPATSVAPQALPPGETLDKPSEGLPLSQEPAGGDQRRLLHEPPSSQPFEQHLFTYKGPGGGLTDEAFAQLSSPEGISWLIERLWDQDDEVRNWSVNALSELASYGRLPMWVEPYLLQKLLDGSEPLDFIRSEVLNALRWFYLLDGELPWLNILQHYPLPQPMKLTALRWLKSMGQFLNPAQLALMIQTLQTWLHAEPSPAVRLVIEQLMKALQETPPDQQGAWDTPAKQRLEFTASAQPSMSQRRPLTRMSNRQIVPSAAQVRSASSALRPLMKKALHVIKKSRTEGWIVWTTATVGLLTILWIGVSPALTELGRSALSWAAALPLTIHNVTPRTYEVSPKALGEVARAWREILQRLEEEGRSHAIRDDPRYQEKMVKVQAWLQEAEEWLEQLNKGVPVLEVVQAHAAKPTPDQMMGIEEMKRLLMRRHSTFRKHPILNDLEKYLVFVPQGSFLSLCIPFQNPSGPQSSGGEMIFLRTGTGQQVRCALINISAVSPTGMEATLHETWHLLTFPDQGFERELDAILHETMTHYVTRRDLVDFVRSSRSPFASAFRANLRKKLFGYFFELIQVIRASVGQARLRPLPTLSGRYGEFLTKTASDFLVPLDELVEWMGGDESLLFLYEKGNFGKLLRDGRFKKWVAQHLESLATIGEYHPHREQLKTMAFHILATIFNRFIEESRQDLTLGASKSEADVLTSRFGKAVLRHQRLLTTWVTQVLSGQQTLEQLLAGEQRTIQKIAHTVSTKLSARQRRSQPPSTAQTPGYSYAETLGSSSLLGLMGMWGIIISLSALSVWLLECLRHRFGQKTSWVIGKAAEKMYLLPSRQTPRFVATLDQPPELPQQKMLREFNDRLIPVMAQAVETVVREKLPMSIPLSPEEIRERLQQGRLTWFLRGAAGPTKVTLPLGRLGEGSSTDLNEVRRFLRALPYLTPTEVEEMLRALTTRAEITARHPEKLWVPVVHLQDLQDSTLDVLVEDIQQRVLARLVGEEKRSPAPILVYNDAAEVFSRHDPIHLITLIHQQIAARLKALGYRNADQLIADYPLIVIPESRVKMGQGRQATYSVDRLIAQAPGLNALVALDAGAVGLMIVSQETSRWTASRRVPVEVLILSLLGRLEFPRLGDGQPLHLVLLFRKYA